MVIKLFSCSAQLRLKLIMLINVKMTIIDSILTLISRIKYRLWYSKSEISIYFGYFSIYEHFKFHDQLDFLLFHSHGVLRMRGSIYQMSRYTNARKKRLSNARLKSAEMNCFYRYL